MDYQELAKRLRRGLLDEGDPIQRDRLICDAADAIDWLVFDRAQKSWAIQRANKKAQKWEARCHKLLSKLAQVKLERDARGGITHDLHTE